MLSVLWFLVLGTLAFFVGSLPFSFWIVKWVKGVDLRTLGSGNAGATNVFRTQGKTLGWIALILDISKGWVAVSLIPILWPEADFLLKLVFGILSVLGHTFTPLLGWKGGKGVATTAGVLLGLLPLDFFIALSIFLVVFLITKIISVSSLTAAAAFPVIVCLVEREEPHFLAALILGLLLASFIFYTHRENIKRLLKGEEKRLIKKK